MDGGGRCYWSQVGVARLLLVPSYLQQRGQGSDWCPQVRVNMRTSETSDLPLAGVVKV